MSTSQERAAALDLAIKARNPNDPGSVSDLVADAKVFETFIAGTPIIENPPLVPAAKEPAVKTRIEYVDGKPVERRETQEQLEIENDGVPCARCGLLDGDYVHQSDLPAFTHAYEAPRTALKGGKSRIIASSDDGE